ncbi:SDR family oxidoreductase [Flavobacteriaceae bacterium]|nr:SDR family oxidoreductase [Flavobacteriaceae bacterium]
MDDLFTLKDKVIVVTGAGGLLGFEYCKAILNANGIPILIDINEKLLKSKVAELKGEFPRCICDSYIVDITNEERLKKNCSEIIAKYEKIDGLINNAANNPKIEDNDEINFSRLENFDVNVWQNDLNIGLLGSFLCIKYYGYEISKNQNGGSIINVSSDLGVIAPNQNLYKKDGIADELQSVKPVTYSVVKHGINGLTKYVSTYWADKNVRCNSICPGGVFNDQPEDFLNKVSKLIPLGRMAKKEELNGIIIYLLSDASTYVNGSIINIDGGRTAW